MPAPVAVIDIGSNTLKLLVATRDAAGRLASLHAATEETRISRWGGGARSELSAEGMQAGLAAVQRLLAAAAPFAPVQIALVATSAVRDAANGAAFCARIRAVTGHSVRILTGAEEAHGIGRGLLAEPALGAACDFYAFDLGGGSLEALAFRARRNVQAHSLRLGCVRLTEQCMADPAQAFTAGDGTRIDAAVRDAFEAAEFRFELPSGAPSFATGGSATTVRAILGAQAGRPLAETAPIITVVQLQALLARCAPLPLAQRRNLPGLPPARADIFPAALATMLAVARQGGIQAFVHSFATLRTGLVAEMLAL